VADLFISYSSKRRPAIEHLSEALENYGYTIWFDHALVAGERFAPEIERQIRNALIVLVIWCEYSVHSRWVAREAKLAEELGTFLPVKIDGARLPLEFNDADFVDLSIWDGNPRGNGLDELIDQISRRLKRDPTPEYRSLMEQEKKWRRYGSIALNRMEKKPDAQTDSKTIIENTYEINDDEISSITKNEEIKASPKIARSRRRRRQRASPDLLSHNESPHVGKENQQEFSDKEASDRREYEKARIEKWSQERVAKSPDLSSNNAKNSTGRSLGETFINVIVIGGFILIVYTIANFLGLH